MHNSLGLGRPVMDKKKTSLPLLPDNIQFVTNIKWNYARLVYYKANIHNLLVKLYSGHQTLQ